jgi:hypothetical protein
VTPPTENEVAAYAHEDAGEAIKLARRPEHAYPVTTIADGADRRAQNTGFQRRWWLQLDEDWPESLRDAYNDAFTRELSDAGIAVVELHFDAPGGDFTNIGVVDLARWEPTFPYDPSSTGWVKQDARSRVGWRRRSILRKLFKKDRAPKTKRRPDDQP